MSVLDQPPGEKLEALYAPLVAKPARSRVGCEARVQALDEAVRKARTWSSRRAANLARNRSCYRLGAALEPSGGLAIDDLALSNLNALGAHGAALLVAQAGVAGRCQLLRPHHVDQPGQGGA